MKPEGKRSKQVEAKKQIRQLESLPKYHKTLELYLNMTLPPCTINTYKQSTNLRCQNQSGQRDKTKTLIHSQQLLFVELYCSPMCLCLITLALLFVPLLYILLLLLPTKEIRGVQLQVGRFCRVLGRSV